MSTDFSRLRPRTPRSPGAEQVPTPPRDAEGTRVLFTAAGAGDRTSGVAVDCSSCGGVRTVSYLTALRLALPSLHLPLVRRGHWSWMRCPACNRRTWVRLRLLV